jgi:hypothetical protein
MSYQISFVQAFAGYYFVKSKFLTTLKRNTLLKRLQAKLQVHFCRQFEIMLLADIGKYRRHIPYRLRHFPSMSLYSTALGYRNLTDRCVYPNINGLKSLSNQVFWQLKKFLSQSSSHCVSSYIFDNHLVERQCKYLLQSELSKNTKTLDLQFKPFILCRK